MRFLLDQDVYAVTARFLRDLGHDVITAGEIGQSRAADTELLVLAGEQERVFVTRDRDFSALVFLRRMDIGVVYLRGGPADSVTVHAELRRVLDQHSERKRVAPRIRRRRARAASLPASPDVTSTRATWGSPRPPWDGMIRPLYQVTRSILPPTCLCSLSNCHSRLTVPAVTLKAYPSG